MREHSSGAALKGCHHERGQGTLEYMMILGIMTVASFLVSVWLLDALRQAVGLLAFKTSVYLTSFPQ